MDKQNQLEYLNNVKEDLNAIGPGFCVLKWYHQEINLAEGQNHSCYHCPQHKIPLKGDLHNTPHKVEQRKIMLEGGKPDECSYCWDIEKIPGLISDRQILHHQFHKNDPNVIASAVADGLNPVYPRYLEVSFTNKCQMSCSYCSTSKSSSWQKEIDKYGPYELTQRSNALQYFSRKEYMYEDTKNPYIKKFWKWFPEAYEHLFVLRVTGGEPLLDKNTYRLIEYLKKHPNENLEFDINTNLMVSEKRVLRYIDLVKDLPGKNKLYVSIDSWGEQAEWIRHGLDIDVFEHNLLRVLANGIHVGFMVTFCLLSIPNISELIFKVAEWKNQFPGQITFDAPYMVEPYHLTARIADENLISKLEKSLKDMELYVDEKIYLTTEYERYKKSVEWIKNNLFTGDILENHRKDFVKFVDEHDRRRGTDWHNSFPEMEQFYQNIL